MDSPSNSLRPGKWLAFDYNLNPTSDQLLLPALGAGRCHGLALSAG